MIKNYQLIDFINEVKQRLNEPINDGLWTTAELTTKINAALLRAAMDTRIVQSDSPVNVASNVSFYRYPDNVLTPLWFYGPQIWGSLRLFPSFLLSLDKQYGGMYQWEKDSANQSQGYVPFSYDKFILWPPPSVNTVVTLHCVPVPSPLVNTTDTTTLPLIAQRTVSIFASYLAMLKSDMSKAQNFRQEYKQRLVSVLELTRHQDQSRPSIMQPAAGPSGSFDRSMANPAVRAYRNSRRYF